MKYSCADFRRMGRDSLKNCWGVAIVALLLEAVITAALGSAGFVGSLIVAGPLMVGVAGIFLAISRYHEAGFELMFDGFKYNFIENMVAYLLQTVFIVLWSLLFIIPGIVKSYAYSMVPFILADNPKMKAMDALHESERMMQGHKMELFLLHLSYIGWILLSLLTCGLLMIYVAPCMYAADTAFYRVLKEGQEQPQANWQENHDFTAGV